jgi:hypothetical protein
MSGGGGRVNSVQREDLVEREGKMRVMRISFT